MWRRMVVSILLEMSNTKRSGLWSERYRILADGMEGKTHCILAQSYVHAVPNTRYIGHNFTGAHLQRGEMSEWWRGLTLVLTYWGSLLMILLTASLLMCINSLGANFKTEIRKLTKLSQLSYYEQREDSKLLTMTRVFHSLCLLYDSGLKRWNQLETSYRSENFSFISFQSCTSVRDDRFCYQSCLCELLRLHSSSYSSCE